MKKVFFSLFVFVTVFLMNAQMTFYAVQTNRQSSVALTIAKVERTQFVGQPVMVENVLFAKGVPK